MLFLTFEYTCSCGFSGWLNLKNLQPIHNLNCDIDFVWFIEMAEIYSIVCLLGTMLRETLMIFKKTRLQSRMYIVT